MIAAVAPLFRRLITGLRTHSASLASLAVRVAGVGLAFVVSLLIGRLYGPEAYGQYALVTQTGMFLSVVAIGGFVMFMAGVRLWKFAAVIAVAAAAAPFAYNKLHDYQRERLLTFLDPERDPLGSGYHIIQSKIAFGSGGLFGKGFLEGTQIRLNFLPEFHTDFVLSVLAEEFGLVGGLVLLALYLAILFVTLAVAMRARTQFARLTCAGMAATLFLHLAINMAMVMGALPVVGVPLPLVSYGGTAMFTLMIGFGIVLSAHIYRQERLGGKLLDDD